MFTFKKDNNIAVAKIVGGKQDGQIIYLQNDPDNHHQCDKQEISSKTCIHCGKQFARPDSMKRHVDNNACRIAFAKTYMKKREQENSKTFDSLVVPDGKLQVLPMIRKDQRNCIYVSGCAGSGKSKWVGDYLKAGQKINKKDIFLFSHVEDDNAFKDIGNNLNQISLDDEFLEEPIDVNKEMHNSVLVFDDIDSLTGDMAKEVKRIQDTALKIGRHSNIDIINTNHLSTDSMKTKTLLNEANAFVIYPKGSSKMSLDRLLKNYIGLNQKTIDKICAMKSRWVYIYRNYPQFIVNEHQICNIDNV